MNKQAILEEIRAYQIEHDRPREMIQEDDITYEDLQNYLHIGIDSARSLMNKLIKSGVYTKHYVNTPNAMRVVFRKVK